MKPQYKKPSLRDTLMANQRALEGLCRLAGTEAPPPAVVLAPKRERAAPKPSEIPSEHAEQVAFVKWFRAQYPKVRIFAVPNAAMRSPQLAAYLRAEGLVSGIPDILVLEWKLAIEMKRQKGGIVSPEQQAWGDYLLGIGWQWHVCRGFEEAREVAVGIGNVSPAPTFADGMTAEDDRRFLELTNDLTHNVEVTGRAAVRWNEKLGAERHGKETE